MGGLAILKQLSVGSRIKQIKYDTEKKMKARFLTKGVTNVEREERRITAWFWTKTGAGESVNSQFYAHGRGGECLSTWTHTLTRMRRLV